MTDENKVQPPAGDAPAAAPAPASDAAPKEGAAAANVAPKEGAAAAPTAPARAEGGTPRREGGPGGGRREGGPGGRGGSGPRREGGGPGGPRKGKRQFFRKRKVCKFCVERLDYIDYKKPEMLREFVQDRGKILPRRITGTCSRHQRWLHTAIQRARNIALLPFGAGL